VGRCGRYLEPITGLQRAGRLTFYGKLKAALKDISGFDPRVGVAPDRHPCLYFRLDKQRYVSGRRPSVSDRIFRVTPGVVAGGAVYADAPAATNSASPQIAQPATPVKFLRVSMGTSCIPGAPTVRDEVAAYSVKKCACKGPADVFGCDNRVRFTCLEIWKAAAIIDRN
jgi:hypothetical protein